jgi:hypothetical protein
MLGGVWLASIQYSELLADARRLRTRAGRSSDQAENSSFLWRGCHSFALVRYTFKQQPLNPAIAMAALSATRTIAQFIRSFPPREYLGYHDTEPCAILASNRCIQLHADAITGRQPMQWKA